MSFPCNQNAGISGQDSSEPDALLQAIQRFPAPEGEGIITTNGDYAELDPDYWPREEASFKFCYPPIEQLDSAAQQDPIVIDHTNQHTGETDHTRTISQLNDDSDSSQCTLMRRVGMGVAPKKPSPWVLANSKRTSLLSSTTDSDLSRLVGELSSSTLAFISSRLSDENLDRLPPNPFNATRVFHY